MQRTYTKPSNKKLRSLYLDIVMANKVENIAWENRRSVNSIIEEALKEWLEKHCK